MKKWKLVAGVLLVFSAGILVGSLGTEIYHRHLSDRFRKNPAERKSFILKKMTAKLDLNAEQQSAFATVLDWADTRKRAHFEKSRREFDNILAQGHEKMKKVLTPDQQQKLADLLERFKKRREERYRRRTSRP